MAHHARRPRLQRPGAASLLPRARVQHGGRPHRLQGVCRLKTATHSPGPGEEFYRATVLRLLIPIGLLTFVNSIDRMNVSFAGALMSRDVHLTPTDFGLGVSAFFVAYLIFQYPHALLLRRWGIRRWLLVSMTLWGIAELLMARVQGQRDFVIARFLLGVGEAGLAPGMTWYISRWTPRATRARAMAITLAAVPFSLVVGGPLCGWLLGSSSPLDLASWRWLFLVSAVPNFAFALLGAWYFVDRPSQARWLSPDEAVRLEQAIASDAMPDIRPLTLPAALRDRRIWVCAAVWFFVMTGSYALTYWLPQIVRELALARSEWLIGTLSALPQAALVAGLVLNARRSDRRGDRSLPTAQGAALAGVALAVAVFVPHSGWALLLLALAGFGIGAAQGVFWTIPQALGIGGGQVPVGAIAAISIAGTAGGVVGPTLLGWLIERGGGPGPGILVLAALLLLAALALAVVRDRRPTEAGNVP